MWNKVRVTILNIFMLLLFSAPLVAHASVSSKAEFQRVSYSETYINPLYADVIKESDLNQPDAANIMLLDDVTYHTSKADAAEELREGMKNRQETIVFGYSTTEDYSELLKEFGNIAMEHTGIGVEGDYLRWHYGGWNGNISGYVQSGTYYLTFTYTMTYYTTQAQEQAVDEKVTQVLAELNIEQLNDYEKIYTIYDYVCDRVTYDHANLEDDTYKLKYTAYAALLDGTAVCQGYANLMYRMLLDAGVDARFISGDGGGPHGWNIVALEDYYYNIDATWDAGKSNYNYFLKGSTDFGNHTRDAEYVTAEFLAEYVTPETAYVNCAHNYQGSEPVFTWVGYDACIMKIGCINCQRVMQAACNIDVEVTDATCLEEGQSVYTATAILGNTAYTDTKSETIAAMGHSGGVATCKEKAVCSVCRQAYGEINPANHTAIEMRNVAEATCKEKGYTGDGYCAACDMMVEQGNATEKKAHAKVIDEGTAASCERSGLTQGTHCSECNEILEKQAVIEPLGHKWSEGVVTKKATPVMQGEMCYTCETCGKTKTEVVKELDAPKKGTVLKKGKATYKVTKAGKKGGTVAFVKTSSKDTSITIPKKIEVDGISYKVTSIATNAFKNNKYAKKITISDNVTSIGNRAFYKCKKLNTITIGTGVKSIGKEAFYNDSKLKTITIKSKNLKSVGGKTFKGIHKNAQIKVSSKKLSVYKKLLKGKGQGKNVKVVKGKF